VPTAYVLLNSDLGSDESIINEVNQILADEDVTSEVQGVYGVYDIVLKLVSDDGEKLRAIITNKIRRISKVQSTLSVIPGQATAYMIGMLQILKVRQRAMDELGAEFDLKGFHRAVLSSGAVPLELLDSVVDRYIADTLATP